MLLCSEVVMAQQNQRHHLLFYILQCSSLTDTPIGTRNSHSEAHSLHRLVFEAVKRGLSYHHHHTLFHQYGSSETCTKNEIYTTDK